MEVISFDDHCLARNIWYLYLIVHCYGVYATSPNNFICFTFGSDALLKIFIFYENTKWEHFSHFRVKLIWHSVSAASLYTESVYVLVWIVPNRITLLTIGLLLVFVVLTAVVDSWLLIITIIVVVVIIVIIEWW